MNDVTKYTDVLIRIVNLSIDMTNLDQLGKQELYNSFLQKYLGNYSNSVISQLDEESAKTVNMMLKLNENPKETLSKINLFLTEKLGETRVISIALDELEKLVKEIIKVAHSIPNANIKSAYDKEVNTLFDQLNNQQLAPH